jgi:hypothetical protein
MAVVALLALLLLSPTRAQDTNPFPPGKELPMASALVEAGLTEVLIIQGDPPSDLSRRTYPNTSEEIRLLVLLVLQVTCIAFTFRRRIGTLVYSD